jgi:hypothetical protein
MKPIPTARPRKARSIPRFSTGNGSARSSLILASQLVHQSSSPNAHRYRGNLLMRGQSITHCNRSCRPYSESAPAALKSP